MQTVTTPLYTLFYEKEDHETSEWFREAADRCVRVIQAEWGLEPPPELHVILMTAWRPFMFHSASFAWKILLVLTYPFWAIRAARLWPYAGGWEVGFGRRQVVGVKPPRCMLESDTSLGKVIHTQLPIDDKVRSILCHELTHAFCGRRRLPNWLKEGLAMRTVDHFLEIESVLPDTLQQFHQFSWIRRRGLDRPPSLADREMLIFEYVRGYWLTRYLEETRPELLKGLLAKNPGRREIERRIAAAFGVEEKLFWSSVNQRLTDHYSSPE